MAWGTIAAIAGSAALNYYGQSEANSANTSFAKDQLWLQDHLSRAGHQREANDLEKAGLNRMLTMGSPGASASGVAGPNAQNEMAPAMSSAIDAIQAKRELAATESQIGVNDAVKSAQAAQALRDTNSAKYTATQEKILKSQAAAIAKKAKYEEKQTEYDSEAQKYDNYQRRIKNGLDTVNSAASSLIPTLRLKTGQPTPQPKQWDSIMNSPKN